MDDLSDAQKDELARRIAREQERADARAAALARDLEDIVTSSAESVRDDEHDPEGQTIAFERAQVASLLAAAQSQMAALQAAALRLDEGRAGRCERCRGAIGYERLLARPAATCCVACADSPR